MFLCQLKQKKKCSEYLKNQLILERKSVRSVIIFPLKTNIITDYYPTKSNSKCKIENKTSASKTNTKNFGNFKNYK